jgi:hypothetical protein
MTQLMPTDKSKTPPSGRHQRTRFGMKLVILGVMLVACAVAASIWYVLTPTPLSAEEQKLVGKWTLPIGPQPPPNAIQQFFELQANRRLVTSGRNVATNATIEGRIGTWRLVGTQLVFELPPPTSEVSVFERILGKGPKLESSVIREQVLGIERDRFMVEAVEGGVGTFLRVVE